MANWRCIVEAHDLMERYEEDQDVEAFLIDLCTRIREAIPARLVDDDLIQILEDIQDNWYQTEDDANECLYALYNWGDDGARMFLNVAFPARASA